MKFENGETIHSATASYRNAENEKSIDAHLLIDGKKSFALEMGINRTAIVHGHIFYPRFSLAVNNDQIAGLSGTVKVNICLLGLLLLHAIYKLLSLFFFSFRNSVRIK